MTLSKDIVLKGVRTHNLQNIDVTIPRDKLVLITGISGSGKSSLAFDTIFSEGQRKYVESMSSYVRQFLGIMDKADLDSAEGLSPTIAIEQKFTSHNPRSTVGTITEIYDYLRLLFARVGTPYCPEHKQPLIGMPIGDMCVQIMALDEGKKWLLLAPVVREQKGEHRLLFASLLKQGFVRARVDGKLVLLDDAIALDKNKKHTIEVVVDRFRIKPMLADRLAESLHTCLELGNGVALVCDEESDESHVFSDRCACVLCGYSMGTIDPNMFSFNSPKGACSQCNGLGVEECFSETLLVVDEQMALNQGVVIGWGPRSPYAFAMLQSLARHYDIDMDAPFANLTKKERDLVFYGSDEPIDIHFTNDQGRKTNLKRRFEGVVCNYERRYREIDSEWMRAEMRKLIVTSPCSSCSGSRLHKDALNVLIDNHAICAITNKTIEHAHDYYANLQLEGNKAEIASRILQEIISRLQFLLSVGLGYLTLDRIAGSLSGGEAQRIRLASQIGSHLVGVTYVLDEPSIGLHQRDNAKLLATIERLRDLGNTIVMVEHDQESMEAADYILDIGPGAGEHGGEIVAQGALKDIKANKKSLTGQYLTGEKAIVVPQKRITPSKKKLTIIGADAHNLCNITLDIPLGVFVCVTGVSGSGKSTLINKTLYPVLANRIHRAQHSDIGAYERIVGIEHLDKVIAIDQSPIGRTPRSNPATYTGLFNIIRDLFTQTPEARTRGYKPGRFSFNVKGGRCEVCKGDGLIKVEMHFLPDVYVNCESCSGARYNTETLQIKYKDQNIAQVLDMTVERAYEFFHAVPAAKSRLQALLAVGLGYIRLGHSATHLSGGEAQRVKLAKEIARQQTGNTLYVLDEPTTGLHFEDIHKLLTIFEQLRDKGNSIIVIEHNLDVIKCADWVIDMGPEGGSGGGKVIATGTPEEVAQVRASHTGRFLQKMLAI